MIQAVTVTNPADEVLRLELSNPDPAGLIVTSITGLGPPKANISTMSLATADGGLFIGARCDYRNIVFNLRMMDLPSVEANRHKVYQFFPIKKMIKMDFETDSGSKSITGYIESNEPNIFSKEEDAQISVICPDPWFYDTGEAQEFFTGVTNVFTFPFSNETTIADKTLIMSSRNPTTTIDFYSTTEVDVGCDIRIDLDMMPGDIHIYNRGKHLELTVLSQKLKNILGADETQSGDYIIISTKPGNKSATYYRNGRFYKNIIAAVDRDSDWFSISFGQNSLAYFVDENQDYVRVTFSYKNAYSGI